MQNKSLDSFQSKMTLQAGGKTYSYYSLPVAAKTLGFALEKMPFSMKILFENLLRFENGVSVSKADIEAFAQWMKNGTSTHEIAYRPARVLMQDFTGVPAVVDLAAMRDAVARKNKNPDVINPLSPVDLVIDHSVQVDVYGDKDSFATNVGLEMERNGERYSFLRWGQKAFNNFRVVPPGTGICHQVNLEYLAKVVWTKEENGETVAYPDTLVGTDSHTTMVNGLGVLGWGVGGIEAEAAMLGQPVSMVIPDVVGFKLTGKMKEGTTATDLVLTVTNQLRKKGVVGKFVEFYGEGLANMTLADRATIANMAPEYGATCGIFPIDGETLAYLNLTGREDMSPLVEAYAKAQGMWREGDGGDTIYTDTLSLDLGSVEPSIAGPKRPQDKIVLSDAKKSFDDGFASLNTGSTPRESRVAAKGLNFDIGHGDVVIAAITSCTNTSNPSVMIGAGLVARKAHALGLSVKPWVKTSLAPGSQVVTEYLATSNLQADLDAMGFNLVGYGCTTCIGNSGPLHEPIEDAIKANNLVVSSVISGNRNFEGRVHPLVKANYLASPPLVVAYAIAGSLSIDITKEPLGTGKDGQPVYLKDIWPTSKEINDVIAQSVTVQAFKKRYADVFTGDALWQGIETAKGQTYTWDNDSTYVQNPPFFSGDAVQSSGNITGARILALLGDSITTDHISPAGNIAEKSPAGEYLKAHSVAKKDFNSYGARRGNHEVMMRGTFANIRIKNEMLGGEEGGNTIYIPTGEKMPIYDASMRYQAEGTPLIVVAGKEYGTGSSRDWAAKGTRLLGVKAVIAESFERIHRSNIVGMGMLPLVFQNGENRQTLKLDGTETLGLLGLETIQPRMQVTLEITRKDGATQQTQLLCRIDTLDELSYYNHGGILQFVMSNLTKAA
ncbi:MAG: aconitate hydratase AcnA [Rickettsiales bacterium]|nr:aconitate hydratase AcnA [Rickettsiales bacterium]